MKAIQTKYLGPTTHRGARIKASDLDGNSITVSYDHGSRNPHRDAAIALCNKMDWRGPMAQGSLGNGHEVFVFCHETFEVEVSLPRLVLQGEG